MISPFGRVTVNEDLEKLLVEVRSALERQDGAAVAALVHEVHPADIAEIYSVLDDEARSNLIFLLPARMTAEVVAYLDEPERDEAFEDLNEIQIGRIVAELPPDEAADVLAELTEAQREGILEQMPDKQADQLEELLGHEEDTAGGIMTPELAKLPESATVAEAVEEVRRMSEDEEIHYVFVVDDGGRLTGIVPLRKLVVSSKQTRLADICTRDYLAVKVTDDQEHVANQIRKYDVSAVPVLDDDGVLVGRVTHDDILDVADEEADEDIYYMAGTEAAELEEDSPARAAFIRMRWLLACMAGSTVSGLIVALFNRSFDPQVFNILFMFVPMMAAMGGNSGLQISTIIIRSLATGDLESRRIGRDFSRELPITMIMAPMCGLVAGGIALAGLPLLDRLGRVDLSGGVVYIAGAVGISMAVAIITASLLGMVLPHLFRKVGVDPAIASGPIVTTTNDIVSVTLYFMVGMLIVGLGT